MIVPELTKIRQQFKAERIGDVKSAVIEQMRPVADSIAPGASIAIATGSREIANIDTIVKTIVQFVKQCGAVPFVIPAMGCHGGESSAGQEEVLASYGITEASIGVPIRSSMEVVELPRGECVNSVFMAREAYESDGVIVVNRIKAHSDYHGPYESGIAKMCVIGLGKARQAFEIHRYGIHGLKELIAPTAKQIIATGKILTGVALVENAYDETMLIRSLKPNEIMEEEPKLLALSKDNMPRLPIDEIDVLIVDCIGKDFSGVGLDPNIIGRIRIAGQAEPERPNIKSIVITDLSDESHGNAIGMGLADITTKGFFEKIDFEVTNTNLYTSTFLERGKIPLIAENAENAVDFALRSCGVEVEGREKIIRIRDTLHLSEIYVSASVLKELGCRNDIEVIGKAAGPFTEDGELTAF